ncbi:MAG TPA: YidC/Oxa1 family insertase periplasmic-domain containing protein, partial [Gemmata sp.]|nr:YidC/Oxa1 family insertase periplasmic-domain containing protein [Gemmata sp.]
WLPKPVQKKEDSTEADARRKAEQEARQSATATARRNEASTHRDRIAGIAWPQDRPLAAVAGTLSFAADMTRPEEESRLLNLVRQEIQWDSKRAGASVAGFPGVSVDPTKAPRRRVSPTLIAFGDDTFYNKVLLTTEGGGVQQVILTRFNEADRLGHEMKGVPLFLIPGVKRVRPKLIEVPYPVPDLHPGKVDDPSELAEPCFTIFHYPTQGDQYPDPTLGTEEWTVPAGYRDESGNPRPKVLPGGEHEMVFEAELKSHFVKFRKTYTLGLKDYHISLKLEIERLPGGKKGAQQVRYQISGPRELPIEGEWYNTTYRVALIGSTDAKGRNNRQYERAADVAIKHGGDVVTRGDGTFRYIAIATQYFASAVAIDPDAEGSTPHPWAYARATTELPFGKDPDPTLANFDDLTVRAASETLDLDAGQRVLHSYTLYNGPAKVRLLGLLKDDNAVDEGLVNRYKDTLGLKTITDYQSPTWLGTFANAIYWTDLVIAFTNLMHGFLALIHGIMPSWLPAWGISIIVLTVVVRLGLMIPSRKQTQMNMKMMEVQKRLAPQFEELKQKYANDPHGYNRAKMQLMMANGVNPLAALGGCLLLLAQMPIMMGLYFCLQESIFFRLEPFLWINNLAAPDMTLWWSEKIPMISTPDAIGGMLYLGPYLNILPILAIGLMFWQQLKMLPPPTDDQSRQQRFMMKMMMFVMPLFFYKFAAGLAVYFIVSTLWGLAERKLIPKPEISKIDTIPGAKGIRGDD